MLRSSDTLVQIRQEVNAPRFTQYAPPPALAHLVQCVWTLRGDRNAVSLEPIVPDGSVEIVLNTGDAILERAADGATAPQPRVAIVGPTVRPTVIAPTGRIEVTGVRVWPWAVRAVLSVPGIELRDRTSDATELGMSPVVLDRLHGAKDPQIIVPTIAGWLHAISERKPHVIVHEMVDRIRTGASSVRGLANAAALSLRHLERLCASEIGLTPKELMRLKRVQDAIALARADPLLTWSGIAVRAGFYDQSHLVREFKALAGVSPSAYRRDEKSLTRVLTAELHPLAPPRHPRSCSWPSDGGASQRE